MFKQTYVNLIPGTRKVGEAKIYHLDGWYNHQFWVVNIIGFPTFNSYKL